MRQFESSVCSVAGTDSPEDVYTALFEECRVRLWNLLRFHLHARIGVRVDPDDVLQDVYLAGSQRFESFQHSPFPSFYLWLRTVALQTLRNVHRYHRAEKRAVSREQSVDFWSQTLQTNWQFAASITSPSQRAMRKEMLARVEQVLASLAAHDQEIVILRHFEELTNAEAATLLGLSEKAASIRYVRAIARLKRGVAEIPATASRPADRTSWPRSLNAWDHNECDPDERPADHSRHGDSAGPF